MITTPLEELDDHYDVVVVGSGAAGLVAAVRAADAALSVLVLEKAPVLGGTTAMGGGVIWASNSAAAKAGGYQDSADDAKSYLTAAAGDRMTAEEVDWYVATSSRAVDYLNASTRVELVPIARPDYHLEWPGAASGGRSLDNAAFDLSSHPGLAALIRPSSYFPALTMTERDALNGRTPDPQLLADREASGVRTMGGALAGALIATALDRAVALSVSAPVTELTKAAAGLWNVGIGDPGSHPSRRVSADTVVIASGGFERSEALQCAFLGFPVTAIGAPSNEGDGLVLGLALGAAVSDMTAVWGVPVIATSSHTYDDAPSGRMANVEMTLPGSIVVNRSGRRFVNEALNYHDAARVFGTIDPRSLKPQNDPAWLIFDSRYLANYPIAGSVPGTPAAWMIAAETLEQLANHLGVDPEGLVSTVRSFNENARRGTDPDFGRGDSAQDRFLGDATHLPNPCLAPLENAPYYAARLRAGTLGTSGGLKADDRGRVLGSDGLPIAGLYAAGNVSAGVFHNNYPGGGATLGSAVTRAFAVGEHIAEVSQ